MHITPDPRSSADDNNNLRGEKKVSALQAYDQPAFKQDPSTLTEKNAITADVQPGDVEPISVEQDGDVIRESDYTPTEYKTLLKKIDRFLLPLMWFCYGIQQTDKTAIGTQAIFGLREDTNLVGQQYSWLTTIFYITYLCGEFPSNFLLQRWAIGRSLSIYMLCWGICVICIAAAQNWSHLMALRGLQGFFECTISPGFLMIIATIANHALHHESGIAAWRCISLFLGSCTIVLAIICFVLLGSPKEVRWLSKEEKRMAAARIVRNKAGRDVTGIKWSWPQTAEAFMDPQLYFCMFNAFLSSVPNGGLTTFANIMLNSFGFTELQVILIEIPRSVPNRRMYVMAASCIPPFVGLLGMAFLPNTPQYRWTKWGMYFMSVPYVLALFLAWTLIPSNVAGRTKKTIISSATFLGYCVGNMCGSQIFKSEDAPRYIPGTTGASVCLGMEFVLICAWRGYYVWQNWKRERVARESGIGSEEQERLGRELGERNVTDLQNPHFRYTM
ncbi:MFS general substrate transporter [Hortaea werneckii]|uniref:Major facilitator superfamily (MFS) profile domain-containing protein n=1 Tax=Hortaea werneckii TaxID=91943 RepID=A0A3M7IKS9_HORWE|nr:MFS general substrate transporter [Hortaea werneckii]KAI6979382.1 MFS general substrate transporter [Hortaea werneckii]KAI7017708.1 MFS general substrate transporter [Hortaea werneckii]KAI7064352.1 MFS general substrate transporter [Hortaea werneckii]KAI7126093.1 MFS general substrate transporter [Hortaea werneckii]